MKYLSTYAVKCSARMMRRQSPMKLRRLMRSRAPTTSAGDAPDSVTALIRDAWYCNWFLFITKNLLHQHRFSERMWRFVKDHQQTEEPLYWMDCKYDIPGWFDYVCCLSKAERKRKCFGMIERQVLSHGTASNLTATGLWNLIARALKPRFDWDWKTAYPFCIILRQNVASPPSPYK